MLSIALTDEEYQTLLDEVDNIRYLIIRAGGMATKSRVEDVLMDMFDIGRGDAHTLTNWAESRNAKPFRLNPIEWVAERAEPVAAHYPI